MQGTKLAGLLMTLTIFLRNHTSHPSLSSNSPCSRWNFTGLRMTLTNFVLESHKLPVVILQDNEWLWQFFFSNHTSHPSSSYYNPLQGKTFYKSTNDFDKLFFGTTQVTRRHLIITLQGTVHLQAYKQIWHFFQESYKLLFVILTMILLETNFFTCLQNIMHTFYLI